MNDDKMMDLLWKRLDKIEEKIDKLFAFRWIIAGAAMAVVCFFEILRTMIEHHT